VPIVPAGVTAASAALLVPHLADPHAALRMLVLGYALCAFSVPLAMSILVILVLRLALHKLPHKDMAASGRLSRGPIRTGALSLLLLGADAPTTFAAAGIPGVGEVAARLGLIGGAVLWGYGVWWLLLAVLTTVRYLREGCRSTSAGGASPFRWASTRSRLWRSAARRILGSYPPSGLVSSSV
jgi:tellurite resistance protein TehA-like permease